MMVGEAAHWVHYILLLGVTAVVTPLGAGQRWSEPVSQ
jgi:hypothetical protein